MKRYDTVITSYPFLILVASVAGFLAHVFHNDWVLSGVLATGLVLMCFVSERIGPEPREYLITKMCVFCSLGGFAGAFILRSTEAVLVGMFVGQMVTVALVLWTHRRSRYNPATPVEEPVADKGDR